jgi:hypothetical protein
MKYLQSIIILFLFNLPFNCFAFDHLQYPEPINKNESKSNFTLRKSNSDTKIIEDKISLIQEKVTPKKVKSNPRKTNKNSDAALAISLGLICIILGLIVLWFISILFGALSIILGLISLIAGVVESNKKNSNQATNNINRNNSYQKNTQPIYRDVVYLKNGSIIKGTIIEQIMNVSLKIETGDGSVFFYKMEEVEKLVKEIVR